MTARDTFRVPRSRSAIVVLWLAQIAVASLVLLTGASKLVSTPAMIAEFDAIGTGQWFRYVVGSIEVASAVLLAMPSLAAFGALLLIPIMLGAIAVHLLVLGGSPGPAMAVLVLSSGIAWARRDWFVSAVATLRSKGMHPSATVTVETMGQRSQLTYDSLIRSRRMLDDTRIALRNAQRQARANRPHLLERAPRDVGEGVGSVLSHKRSRTQSDGRGGADFSSQP
jgi:putative oxidoreductase